MAGRERCLRLALGVSLLAHASLLLLPVQGEQQTGGQAVTPRKLVLSVRRSVPPFAQTRPDARAGEKTGTRRARAAGSVRTPPSATLEAKASAPMPTGAGEAAARSAAPPVPLLNLDDLREQARQLGPPPAGTLLRGGGTDRPRPAAGPDPLDQPVLRALSKHLGRPLSVVSEQVMTDGSRLIRFSGNLCLRIPRHLPAWQENPVDPTMRVPMTCGD